MHCWIRDLIAKRFTFTAKDGRSITGVVQGTGGYVQSLYRLKLAQEWAKAGKSLNIYEPKPGCICVYPEFNAFDNGRRVTVDLREVEITETVSYWKP